MVIIIFFFIVGFIFLIKGADFFIEGSSALARRFGISSFVIGLTVVSFGTSMPEFAINIYASYKQSTGIAFGNVIGANLANTLLILGVSAVLCPLLVKRATVNKEIPFSLLVIFAVIFLVNDALIDHAEFNGLTRSDGLMLILFLLIFAFYTFGISREKDNIFLKVVGEMKEEPAASDLKSSITLIVVGLVGLVAGGNWIVQSGIKFASLLGVSQAMIGLTVVSIGTTLPELAASATAAMRGKTDIAVGNVIGSNIFNLLAVLGVSSIVNTIVFDPIFNTDLLALAIVTILLVFLIYFGRRNMLSRSEGLILISLYVCYLAFAIYRG